MPAKKNRALLGLLAMAPRGEVTRDRLAALLWSDRGEQQARSSLRQALAALHKDFAELDADPLVTNGDRVAIDPNCITIDVTEFLSYSASSDPVDLRRAAELYVGPFLDGLNVTDSAFEEWLREARTDLAARAVKVLGALAGTLDGAERVIFAERLVALDPLREASHLALMQAHIAQGQTALAIKQFETCKLILKRELGVEPGEDLQKLRRILEIKSNKQSTGVTSDREPTIAVLPPDLVSSDPAQPLALVLPDKPSIAVLPFINMSGDPEQEYFSDGITESIITGLSRFRDLFVIASSSSFFYKGKPIKIQDVSRDLGVRYILEGSVQKSNEQVRITTQLIDGFTGAHLWAERFDRQVTDLFTVQDEVTETIVGTLAAGYGGRLRKTWQRQAERTKSQNFQAFDYLLRGLDLFDSFTKEDTARAREFFYKAIELDPSFAKAYSKLAWTHLMDATLGLSEDYDQSIAKGREFATKAIECDDDESWAHWALAGYYMIRMRHDLGLSEFQRAIELNPNDAEVLTDFGFYLSYAGRAAEGIEAAHKAMRLNPHYPEWYVAQLGQIYFDARRYAEAVTALESLRSLDTINVRLYLAASHALLGHADEAQKAIVRVLELDTRATVQKRTNAKMAPYRNSEDLEHFGDGIRKAGLPE